MYNKAISLPIDPFYISYNNIRRLKLIVLSHVLSLNNDFEILPYDHKLLIVTRIENSCANETIRKAREYNLRCVWDNEQFVNIYHTICYNITSILERKNNTLIKKILDKSMDLNIIANMSCKELSPENYTDITKEINKRVNIEQTVKYTEMYFCKKCKRNQTTVERVQNRSLDESSSFHITCLFCGTKWFT
jgi:DNA-directed RNA polymerase subunit M/transcription elongation factor TFIIS